MTSLAKGEFGILFNSKDYHNYIVIKTFDLVQNPIRKDIVAS